MIEIRYAEYEAPKGLRFSMLAPDGAEVSFMCGERRFTLTDVSHLTEKKRVFELSSNEAGAFAEFSSMDTYGLLWSYIDARCISGLPAPILQRVPNMPAYTEQFIYTDRGDPERCFKIVLPMNTMGMFVALAHAAAIEIAALEVIAA